MNSDDSVHLILTREEARFLTTAIHLAGFQEKKQIPKSIRPARNDVTRVMGRILKKIRKAMKD